MARRYRPRSRFVATFVISLVALALYYSDDIDKGSLLVNIENQNQPTAFAEGTRLVEYDELGLPRVEVRSNRSFYYDQEQYILTEQPEIRFKNEHADEFILSAREGEYRPEDQTINLINEVNLSRKDGNGALLTLKTEDLLVDIANDFISTSREVTIEQGGHHLSAQGIQASLQDRKIVLPARVRGIYDISQ